MVGREGGGQSYQREAHTETQQTTSVGDVGDPGDLLVLQELFNLKYNIVFIVWQDYREATSP